MQASLPPAGINLSNQPYQQYKTNFFCGAVLAGAICPKYLRNWSVHLLFCQYSLILPQQLYAMFGKFLALVVPHWQYQCRTAEALQTLQISLGASGVLAALMPKQPVESQILQDFGIG